MNPQAKIYDNRLLFLILCYGGRWIPSYGRQIQVIIATVDLLLMTTPQGLTYSVLPKLNFCPTSYQPNHGNVNAKMVRYAAVSGIVICHVVAVYVEHAKALRVFPTTRQALNSQIPMLQLMVGHTMVSLWILSQQIVA